MTYKSISRNVHVALAALCIVAIQSAWATSYTNDTNWGGADWTLADGDVIAGVHTNVGQFIVPGGATVTVEPYDSGKDAFGRTSIFAASASISGNLVANAAGFPDQIGPGAASGRSGAGHGGRGSAGDSGPPGGRYGSPTQPTDLGSGGSHSNTGYVGGRGGGAVRLYVAGTLAITGTISAAGQNGQSSWTGGGSGGSIWLTADTLTGNGSVTADGGDRNSTAGGGGGGGRIAFDITTYSFTGTVRASGGLGRLNRAGHGTLNFSTLYSSSDDVVIAADIALCPSGNWAFNSLAVSNSATLDIQSDTDLVSRVSITNDIFVAAGATISADGEGFLSQGGPGGGIGRSGGSYGGRGSVGSSAGTSPNPYGSVHSPTNLGSGGGYLVRGGRGGGAVILDAGGTVTLNGTVSANGGGPEGGYAGSGSGGSIWIAAATIAGNGMATADGGPPSGSGAGGGGRIAFTTPDYQFTGSVRASGQNYQNRAGFGTFNFMDVYGPADDVIVTEDIALSPSNHWAFGSLTVTNGATLDVQSTPTLVSRIATTNDVVVAAGATLSADGMGFPHASGPGAGHYRAGGSYGGRGCTSPQGGYCLPTYGSVTQPDQLGSGGNGSSDSGGHGGGAVILDVGGTLSLNGTVSANGWKAYGGYAGGGSGGSAWLKAATIQGSGMAQANGGVGSNGTYGGGGGGRIAFTTPDNQFSGVVQASGAEGPVNRAGNGTFNFADLYGASDALVVTADIALPPSNGWAFSSLTISNGAVLDIQSTTGIVSRITVAGDVAILAGATLSADGLGAPRELGDGAGERRSGGSYGGKGGDSVDG